MRLSQGGGIWATIPHLLLLLLLLFIPNYFITISNLGSAFHTEYSHPPSNPPIQPCSPSSSYFAPSLPPPSPHPSPYLITPPASDILIPPPPSLPPLITPSAFDILMFVFCFWRQSNAGCQAVCHPPPGHGLMVLATPLPRLPPPFASFCPFASLVIAFRCAAFGTSRLEAAEVDAEFLCVLML